MLLLQLVQLTLEPLNVVSCLFLFALPLFLDVLVVLNEPVASSLPFLFLLDQLLVILEMPLQQAYAHSRVDLYQVVSELHEDTAAVFFELH